MHADARAHIIDSFDDAVVVIDADRLVVAWNASMERLTSCARADALNRSIDDVFASFPQEAWVRPLELAQAGDRGRAAAVHLKDSGVWAEPHWAPRADAPGVMLLLRDVTEEHKRALFLRALETVGRSLTSSLDLDQVLDTICEKTREVMGADSAMVATWDAGRERLTVMRATGRLTADYAPGGIPVAGGPVSTAAREGRVVATSDVLADPQWQLDTVRRRHIAREGFQAVAAAPLVVKGVVHGALAVHQWAARAFSADEMALLALLAEQAALALENARLYTQARRRGDRLRELAQLEQMVAASLDPDAVLRAIAEAAVRLVGADSVQAWTADHAARVLRLRASSGTSALPSVPEEIPFGEGITGRAAELREALYVADVTREPGALSAEWARQTGISHLLAVPMLSGDDLLGVVTVRSRAASLASEEDRALITTLASQAGMAVQNAGAYAAAVARGARLQALISLTRSITSSLDTADVIRRIVDAAASLRPRALSAVHVLDPEQGAMRVTASPEMESLPLQRGMHVGLPGIVTTERRPVLVARPLEDPRTLAPAWWRDRSTASYYGVPIMVGDTLVGVLDYIVPEGVPDREEQEALNLLAAHAGVAIRNASLYHAEHVQTTRIRALAAVNQRISSTLDLDLLLQTITESAAQLIGVRFASFWLADERTRTLTLNAYSDADLVADFPVRVASYGDGSVGWVARHQQPVVVEDVTTDDRMLSPEWWRRNGLRSFAGFPVVAEGEILAVLALCHTQPVLLTPSLRDVVDMFLAQAAVAIRNARLYRDARRRRDIAEALAWMGRELSSTLELDRIAALVVSATVELLGARGGAVYRYEAGDDTLRSIVVQSVGGPPWSQMVLRPGEGIAGRALSERRIIASADVLNDPAVTLTPELRAELKRLGHRAVIGLPLLGTRGAVGALVIGAELGREFSAEDIQAAQAFGDQAALAFENARLYAESQRERQEATALADTARSLALSLDVDEVGERIAEAMIPVLHAHSSSLYRINAEGALTAVARGGAGKTGFNRNLAWPKGAGVAARCVEARRPVWTRDVLADEYTMPAALREAIMAIGSRAVLAAPLNVKSQVVGALVVAYTEPRDFEEREIALLQAFADQAALALENAQLYASARDNLARLRETQAQLVQAAKLGALGQLVSGVAHELNNPLSVIIGYGQLLLSREMPPPLRRPVELMVSQGDRMAKIVRNLLYFARQRPPERTSVDLQETLEQTLALRLNQLAISGISVRREYSQSLPPIAADSHQLQQVFLNLLLNAEQAILGAGRAGEIVVRTAPGPTADTVVAQVVDDGPGISAEDLGRVFEPFYTTKEVGQGTGLGLSVSYGIVQEHGGRLSVESRPGATTFTVELPVRSAMRPTTGATPVPRSGGGRPALVVEDEPAVLDLIVTLLTDSGWHVDVAPGGRAGLERVLTRRYALIVSDVRMPEGGGDEFYRKAIAHDAELARKFLFITGDTANPSAWKFLKEARVPVLEKPFAAGAFLEAVRSIAALTASPSRA
jgi:GAF domain-containing protein